MPALRTVLTISVCCLTLAACDFLVARTSQEDPDTTAQPAETPSDSETLAQESSKPENPVAVASVATIDWEAARADMAAAPGDTDETGFQVASGGSAPPVPVLLPTGIVIPQGAESNVRFQPMSDGYYAAYPGIDYDIVVNGTNEVLRAGNPEEFLEKSDLNFTPTMTGAQVSFSRYGADYLVEFECKAVEDDEADCISEQEALDVTTQLVIAGTR